MLMKAEQWWFSSGVLIAKDTSNSEKNDMNWAFQPVNFQGWHQLQFILGSIFNWKQLIPRSFYFFEFKITNHSRRMPNGLSLVWLKTHVACIRRPIFTWFTFTAMKIITNIKVQWFRSVLIFLPSRSVLLLLHSIPPECLAILYI